MRNPLQPAEPEVPAVDIEEEHRLSRARLAAATGRFSRALAVSERLKFEQLNPLELGVAEDALLATRDAAEANFRACLEVMRHDSSDSARWRCARALIEFDRLSEKVTARRIR